MKNFLLVISFFFLFSLSYSQQIVDSLFYCQYATWDEQPNSTGYNTSAVGVFGQDKFVALVTRVSNSTNYLVGYKNATASTGRIGRYPYGTSGVGGFRQKWVSGLDEVEMLNAFDVAVWKDSIIFVANNDTLDRNILVFYLGSDTVYSSELRLVTNQGALFAIDVDSKGKVYVTKEGTETTNGSVLVFNSINEDINWLTSHISNPIATIIPPERGFLRGLAVQKFGSIIYVANNTTGRVYCYVGTPTTGYTLYNGFNLIINDDIPNSTTLKGRPLGLKLMPEKNLLLVACHSLLAGSAGYPYGRIYVCNPNTGEILGKIDCAAWNFAKTGSYAARENGTVPDVSGYTSPYSVDADNDGNIYTVSFYGWTVDKWKYNGTLPTIPITLTNVETVQSHPELYSLEQNYPNPFNPSTTITFSLKEEANVDLTVFDHLGRKITDLITNSTFNAGTYKITFDASKLSSGIYFYTLKANNFTATKKMTLIK